MKNLNSFRSVERAIKFELDRMTKLLEEGKSEEIVQETRGWDESKQKLFTKKKNRVRIIDIFQNQIYQN